jgi:hypothetical protein
MTVTLVRLGDQRFFIASRDVPLGCHLAHEPPPSDPQTPVRPFSIVRPVNKLAMIAADLSVTVRLAPEVVRADGSQDGSQ